MRTKACDNGENNKLEETQVFVLPLPVLEEFWASDILMMNGLSHMSFYCKYLRKIVGKK